MQKNIEEKLKSLAQRVLNLNDNADIDLLKKEVMQIYDELCTLEYLKNNPELDKPKRIKKSKKKSKQKHEGYTLFSIEEEIGVDANFEDIFVKKESEEMKPIDMPFDISASLNDEIESPKETINVENKKESTEALAEQSINSQAKNQASLNDKINKTISVDLNDRIAFVNHLFSGSQEDFNRVLSQLNSFDQEHEAKDFLLNQVKPDYSWQGYENYEERFIYLIERKFM